MAEYYAKLYARTFDEYSSYFEYYRQYFGQEVTYLGAVIINRFIAEYFIFIFMP